MKKILWVKFAWSDYYRGTPVKGNFGWLNNKQNINNAPGHEAFNFDPAPDGTFYCYVPPQSKDHCPSNLDPNGWTVICLAKKPNKTGIHIVGWYENATLHGQWLDVPDDIKKEREKTSNPGYDWSYCITSKTAYFIPPEHRTEPFSDVSIRIGKYSFLTGPGIRPNVTKNRVLQLLERKIEAIRKLAVKSHSGSSYAENETSPTDPLSIFGNAEHRKTVEQAAENAVIQHYQNNGYICERCTHLPCGYDFAFTKGKSVLHVEVKGTASSSPRFYLTRNEYKKGLASDPSWRLTMVTSALADHPVITEYNSIELKNNFDLEPYVYIGNIISIS